MVITPKRYQKDQWPWWKTYYLKSEDLILGITPNLLSCYGVSGYKKSTTFNKWLSVKNGHLKNRFGKSKTKTVVPRWGFLSDPLPNHNPRGQKHAMYHVPGLLDPPPLEVSENAKRRNSKKNGFQRKLQATKKEAHGIFFPLMVEDIIFFLPHLSTIKPLATNPQKSTKSCKKQNLQHQSVKLMKPPLKPPLKEKNNLLLKRKLNKPMWKPQQLVDRNCFSLWHIMSNRKHAM